MRATNMWYTVDEVRCMPQIKFRGTDTNKLLAVSKGLVDELADAVGCPHQYFTLECIQSTYIQDGTVVPGYPFVEVAWFDRGQEVQDRVAGIITRYMQQAGYANVDVFFTIFEKTGYYENGEHF